MNATKIRFNTVRITENEEGWLLDWGCGTEQHPTAAEALDTVRQMDAIMIKAIPIWTVVEWTATTRIGRSVVEVLQS